MLILSNGQTQLIKRRPHVHTHTHTHTKMHLFLTKTKQTYLKIEQSKRKQSIWTQTIDYRGELRTNSVATWVSWQLQSQAVSICSTPVSHCSMD